MVTLEAPEYALRCLVAIDVTVRVINSGYSSVLTRVYDKSGEETTSLDEELQNKSIFKIVDVIEEATVGKKLEKKLINCVQELLNGENPPVNDAIKTGFDIIRKHYLENLEDD